MVNQTAYSFRTEPDPHVPISRRDVIRRRWTTRLPAIMTLSLVAKNGGGGGGTHER